jgi:glutamyl-Q tRNA(Asp) synthetase
MLPLPPASHPDSPPPGGYRGRFAPSPTGPLHAGSLVAALASWLDARAHGGTWLVRIEDVDTPRCSPEAAHHILAQLSACGLQADEAPLWQSSRSAAYETALQRLQAAGLAYPCGCTRSDVEAHWLALGVAHMPGAERIYPGTCRSGLRGKPARAVRLRVDGVIEWTDRRLGPQRQDLVKEVGDFVLRRADGLWAYQLAVVVDDAAQGITQVVRGADLADNTARQIALQRALQLPTPGYLHTPLVLAADGHKLSKQNGAQALDVGDPLAALQAAGAVLGLPQRQAQTVADWLAQAVPAWAGIIAGFATRSEP